MALLRSASAATRAVFARGSFWSLAPGDSVQGFVRRNPEFRPANNRKPVILIGAGTGIGPLAGFARANHRRRRMHLYFGARHPDSDLFYEHEMQGLAGRWPTCVGHNGLFAQSSADLCAGCPAADADRIAGLISEGAQVLVCGGRDMAAGVADALADILTPAGLTPAMLKAEGRYVEDTY